jgi:eukaryotic-like serine/threonine-protein kinase
MPEPSPPPPNTHSDPDLSGAKLGNYQLLRRLGRGGMAEVYLAEQISLRRQVAFKVLKRDLAEDEAYVRRFHNEARAAASLVHANIVQIHEVGCFEGIHFIAQEYVAGQNLKQWLARHRTADTKTAVHVMRQVAAALHRASQQGIIHRDIKPENIMLAKTGEVKVADFGLARVGFERQSVDLTQVGVTLGTPLYMSPEQVEGRAVDPRSDLYSFGVTSYEMLAGRPPFEGDTPLSVAVQHLRTPPERLENHRPDIPEGLCRVVHRLLEKAPTDRYQSATDIIRDLRTLHVEGLEQWPAGAAEWDNPDLVAFTTSRSNATMRLANVMESQSSRPRSHPLARRLALLVALGVLLGSVGAWFRHPDDLLALQAPTVERKDSVRLQYWHAIKLNTEDAWHAVEEYFPPAEDPVHHAYALQAKQRLAALYRETLQFNRAMALYHELVKQAPHDPQIAASGYIGQANLLAQQGQIDLAAAELAAAVPLLKDLPREQLRNALQWLDADLRIEFEKVTAGEKSLQDPPFE